MNYWSRTLTWLMIAALGCLCLLSACGQKGPLYLPEPEQEQTTDK